MWIEDEVVRVLANVIVIWPLDLVKVVVHEYLDVSTEAFILWLKTNINNFKIISRQQHVVVEPVDIGMMEMNVDMDKIVCYDIFTELLGFIRSMSLQCLVLQDMWTLDSEEFVNAPQEKWISDEPQQSFYVVILLQNCGISTPAPPLHLSDSHLQKELHIIYISV